MTTRDRLKQLTGPLLAEEAASTSCRACGATRLIAFYEVKDVPSQTCVLLDSQAEAVAYPRGDILLAFCERCGFIQNVRFDPQLLDYSKPTEESQAFSPVFNQFANWLADELTTRYELEGRTVLEVGCGKGDFLMLLADRGIKHGLGIDPGYLSDRISRPSGEVEFIRDWYGPKYRHLTGDLVLTRHLMEHVPNVLEFLIELRGSVTSTEGASLFTEVPDVARVLRDGAFWDVYYEHCSYFTLGSLGRALGSAGFDVHWLETGFDDQYLLAGAAPENQRSRSDAGETPEVLAQWVVAFAEDAATVVARWRDEVAGVVSSGGRVAVWGGGSKAVAFLTSIGANDVAVVDINPHKQGKWLPGASVVVREPAHLRELRPDLVIVMNPVYRDEIAADLASMDLAPRVAALG